MVVTVKWRHHENGLLLLRISQEISGGPNIDIIYVHILISHISYWDNSGMEISTCPLVQASVKTSWASANCRFFAASKLSFPPRNLMYTQDNKKVLCVRDLSKKSQNHGNLSR